MHVFICLCHVQEDIGLFKGATGGFAGGEKGLRTYIEEGEVRLRKPGEAGRKQFSPVSLSALLVAAGAGGGLLLNEATDLSEGMIRTELLQVSFVQSAAMIVRSVVFMRGVFALQAPIDDNTKTLLVVAVGLLTVAGVVGSVRSAVSSLSEQVQEGAMKLLVLGGFGLGVFLAARAVLEL